MTTPAMQMQQTDFGSFGMSICMGQVTKNKEARTGTPMVLLLCLATNLPKPKHKEAEKQRSRGDALSIVFRLTSGMLCCCSCDQLMCHLFGQNECWKSQNKVKNRKQPMPTFCLVAMSIGIGRAIKNKEARTGMLMVPNQLAKNQRNKEAEKQRGCLVDRFPLDLWHVMLLQPGMTPKTTNKEEPMLTVQSMDCLFGWDEGLKSL